MVVPMRRRALIAILYRVAATVLLAGIVGDVLEDPCELLRAAPSASPAVSAAHTTAADACEDCGSVPDCFCCSRPTAALPAMTVAFVATQATAAYPSPLYCVTAGVLPLPYHPPLARI